MGLKIFDLIKENGFFVTLFKTKFSWTGYINKGENKMPYIAEDEKLSSNAQTENCYFDIGWAVLQMRNGRKVARKGWNGKGMWIVLMPELSLPPYSSQKLGAKVNDRTAKYIGFDTPLESQPYIAMWTAQGKWQPGWICSQSDLLATDWQIVE